MYNNGQSQFHDSGDRFFFFPFLTGALLGGAAVGLSRPRPIVNAAPVQPYPYPVYTQPMPYSYPGYSSVNYNSSFMPANPMGFGGSSSSFSYYM